MKFDEYDKRHRSSFPDAPERAAEQERMPLRETPQDAAEDFGGMTPYRVPGETMNFSVLQQNLGNCLRIIDDEVMKGYLSRLDELPVVALEPESLKSLPGIQFFQITELVYQENEFSPHKLATMFHSLASKPCTLSLMIQSDGRKNRFYLGVRSLDKRHSSGTMMQMLKQSLIGMFPGSRIAEYYNEDMERYMESLRVGAVSGVTCVADFKRGKETVTNREFVQGLEKFVDSMQGKVYTAVFLANNLSREDLMAVKKEYETIYTQIAPFATMQMNFSSSSGKSASSGQSEGTTESVNYGRNSSTSTNVGNAYTKGSGTSEGYGTSRSHGTSDAQSDGTATTTGTSDAVSKGTFRTVGGNIDVVIGVNAGVGSNQGTSHSTSLSDSVSRTLSHGISESQAESTSRATSKSESMSESYSAGTQQGESYGAGEAFSLVNTKTLTDTLGTSRGITLNAKNRTLSSITERIDRQLKRIDDCESFGMWNFAAYFMGESMAETETAAYMYESIVAGEQSGVECAAVNTWTGEKLKEVSAYVRHFMHPNFIYRGFDYDTERLVQVNPAVLVSTNELSIHMGLPFHSVKGLPVVEHAVFAQETLRREEDAGETVALGNVYHLGEETETGVHLDLDSLAMHTFVTGSTGAGKSNAVYHLLSEISKKQIPFLVVEPAKGEYKEVFSDVRCFGTNPNIGEIVRLNPFSFPEKVHILEHIDRIVEIFNACWPMYAAMPAVLKESIEQAYIAAGWDLDLSVNSKMEGLYPTFDDVLFELKETIDKSEYSSDTKGDYIGSLSTRLKSLTNGINGRIFVGDEMDLSLLFDQSAILDISSVGSMETKALIMGLVILKLQEYRKANAKGRNAKLRHITVLEEAHNLLRKTSSEQSQDSSNLQGKSVEMLTNTIAEIRTYGEGFVIVDQAPNLLDTAAIRNTNTKIVLRLPEGSDREITGASMALSKKQIQEISKLPTGVAAVYQNDWQEAVLCRLPYFQEEGTGVSVRQTPSQLLSKKSRDDEILHGLLKHGLTPQETDKLKREILAADVSARIRKELILNLESRNLYFEWAVADFIQKNYRFQEVFKGTNDGEWDCLKDLSDIMLLNISDEFDGFDEKEKKQILYFICRIEHERFPENEIIEQLRVEYLKKEAVR